MVTAIPKRLEGKVAVVTGSTAGIGLEIAKRFAREGSKVIISGRYQHKVNATLKLVEQEGMYILGTACHVGKPTQRIRMLEMANYGLGGIDILVINAGINPEMFEVLDTTERAWNKIFDINVKSSYRIAKETVPYMKEKGKGKIIINTAISAFQPTHMLGAYAVSKASLVALTKAAALQLAADNITVNAIAPGVIATRFSETVREGESARTYLNLIPMNRFGKPEEVAGAAAYLASEDADYVTGECICVTGGMVSRL